MAKAVFVYVLDHLPHPEVNHLASRIRGLGTLHKYEEGKGFALIVAEGKTSDSEIDLNDAIVEYINDRRTTVLSFCKVSKGDY